MQVYKAYFKIIKKHIFSLLIYFGLFVAVAMIISNIFNTTAGTDGTFTETKIKLAFINEDAGAPLAENLGKYLAENAQIVQIKDTTEEIQDALFFGQISYALRVPAGFSESFMSGGNVSLQKTAPSLTAGSVNIDFLVNRYLNTAQLYADHVPGITQGSIVQNVEKDLAHSADVQLNDYNKSAEVDALSYYFRFIAYSMLAILIMGITTIMMVFNQTDLNNRNLCSPLGRTKMNVQMVLANATFALIVWAALCAMTFVMYGSVHVDTGIVLLCVNALIFTVVSLAIAFLAGKFIKSVSAQAAIANVVSLGISFISGVFVGQELLGKTVLTIASFTPGYWYVKAVNDIRDMTVYSTANMLPVIYSMLIQLGFAAALFIIALAVSKQSKSSLAK